MERSRSRALLAAQSLMIEGGLDAITPTRVADRSGLGRKTIYRLWPTRVDLLRDVLRQASRATHAVTGDLVVDIRTHLLALTGALTRGPLGMILGALAERASFDPEFDALRTQLAEEGRAPLIEVLTRAIEQGALSSDEDPAVVASVLEGPIVYEAVVRGRVPDRNLIDRVIALALDASALAENPDRPSVGPDQLGI